ncbi:hypothetical protein D3C78_1242330 [compost metagenome]
MLIACSIRVSHGRRVKVRKPIICCSMPVPQLVDFSEWPTMNGGTRNQRQISSTLKARDSSSWASFGLMPMVLASIPPSSSGDSPAFSAPEMALRLARNSSRCSFLSTCCMVKATVGARPFSKVLLAALFEASAEPNTLAPYSMTDRPQSPSMVKPGMRKISASGISRWLPSFSV